MSRTPMNVRTLGKDGPNVAALGFGLMGLSQSYGPVPSEEERFKVLDRAVELGATFWDTADHYGDSHALLNKWFKRTGKRNEIFLATKAGFLMENGRYTINSSGKYLKEAFYKSIAALGIDHVDLYYAHALNGDIPVEDTMRGLAELKAEGKIHHIGLCSLSSTALRRAIKIAPVDAVQIEYSAFTRDIEGSAGTDLLAACRELGIAVVCLSPLGRGLLTGTLTKESITGAGDVRNGRLPRFSGENFEANTKLVNRFKAIADKKGCTTSQLALAWLLKQGDDIIPIPGTKKIQYLEENWGSLDVKLTENDEAEIRGFLDAAVVAGGSYPDAYKHMAFVTTKEES